MNKHPKEIFAKEYHMCFLCGKKNPSIQSRRYYCSGCVRSSVLSKKITFNTYMDLMVQNFKFFLTVIERHTADFIFYHRLLQDMDNRIEELKNITDITKLKNWALLNKNNKNFRIEFISKEILKH